MKMSKVLKIIKAIAINDKYVLVSTDMRYIRFFTIGGVQLHIISIPGPVVSTIGKGEIFMIIYHGAGSYHGYYFNLRRSNIGIYDAR